MTAWKRHLGRVWGVSRRVVAFCLLPPSAPEEVRQRQAGGLTNRDWLDIVVLMPRIATKEMTCDEDKP